MSTKITFYLDKTIEITKNTPFTPGPSNGGYSWRVSKGNGDYRAGSRSTYEAALKAAKHYAERF